MHAEERRTPLKSRRRPDPPPASNCFIQLGQSEWAIQDELRMRTDTPRLSFVSTPSPRACRRERVDLLLPLRDSATPHRKPHPDTHTEQLIARLSQPRSLKCHRSLLPTALHGSKSARMQLSSKTGFERNSGTCM